MKIYIYVDDIRDDDYFYNHYLSPEWRPIICRNYGLAVQALTQHLTDEIFIDLDHDLGFDNDNCEYSGYDICKFIIQHQIPLTGFHIHSMNPVGAQNMRQLLTHYGYKEY